MATGKEDKEVIWNASVHVKPGQRKRRTRSERAGTPGEERNEEDEKNEVTGREGSGEWYEGRLHLVLPQAGDTASSRSSASSAVGAAEGERGHTRLYPWLTHYTHGDQDSSVPARTSVSRSSREYYAVLSDGPESTERLHSDRLCAGTRQELPQKPPLQQPIPLAPVLRTLRRHNSFIVSSHLRWEVENSREEVAADAPIPCRGIACDPSRDPLRGRSRRRAEGRRSSDASITACACRRTVGMPRCAVPGCRSGYTSATSATSNDVPYVQRHFFKPPKDPNVLREWSNAAGRANFERTFAPPSSMLRMAKQSRFREDGGARDKQRQCAEQTMSRRRMTRNTSREQGAKRSQRPHLLGDSERPRRYRSDPMQFSNYLHPSPSPSTPSRSPGIRQQQSTSPSTVQRPKRPTQERRPPAWLSDYQTD
ncbi:hypothetical protein HPB50_017336 [Hyalomma asiaticum]|uniref:Uncharacterized protein n=1 Tax=Hyalomma asiaticum TaxID=266040 RepID=A0ACB7S084_HYAAI|nr:hypothetical protein HPB50_017336 [Hyalomma asiaticum]